MIAHLCMCDSIECSLSIQVPLTTAQKLDQKQYIIIIHGCKTGPKQTDMLIKQEQGYDIYEPAEF